MQATGTFPSIDRAATGAPRAVRHQDVQSGQTRGVRPGRRPAPASPRGHLAALATALIVATVLSSPSPARAQASDRPVTLVVGYAAGGATDIVARLIAKAMTDRTGQAFVVENRAGANSNIGAELVAKATADGHTLYVGSIANTINQTLYRKLGYDLKADFRPVGMLASISNLLVVNPKVPAQSVADYIRHAKANPGKLTCASSGSGSSIHMSCELFKQVTGTDILHIPYKGSGPAVVDLVGGQVDSMFDNLPSSLPHVQGGRLRALGVTAGERVPFAPDVPTFAEAGVGDFVVTSWFGLIAPAKVPDDVVDRLNKALNEALASDEIRMAYQKAGFQMPPRPNSSGQFGRFVDSEVARWQKVVKASGASVD